MQATTTGRNNTSGSSTRAQRLRNSPAMPRRATSSAAKNPATAKNTGMRNMCRNHATASTTTDRPASAAGQTGCIKGL